MTVPRKTRPEIGDAVTVIYTIYPRLAGPDDPRNCLYIALLLEDRYNMMSDKPVLCAVGDFKLPDKSRSAAAREASEETGNAPTADMLPGLLANCDRDFWVKDLEKNEAGHAIALKIPYQWLTSANDGSGAYMLRPDAKMEYGKAKNLRFFHWKDAILNTPDAIARSTIAQLLAYLF